MKISELIAELTEMRTKHGDLPVRALAEEYDPYWGAVRAVTTGWQPGDAEQTVTSIYIEAASSDYTETD